MCWAESTAKEEDCVYQEAELAPEDQHVQHHPLAGDEQCKHEPEHTETFLVPIVGRSAIQAKQQTAGQAQLTSICTSAGWPQRSFVTGPCKMHMQAIQIL